MTQQELMTRQEFMYPKCFGCLIAWDASVKTQLFYFASDVSMRTNAHTCPSRKSVPSLAFASVQANATLAWTIKNTCIKNAVQTRASPATPAQC